MKNTKYLLTIPVFCFVLLYGGCTESTSSTANPPAVDFYAQMTNASVTPAITKTANGNQILSHGIAADSLHVEKIRILVRDVKLHGDKDDDSFPGHDLKVGPFLMTIEPGSVSLSAYASMPQGSFDHVKMEVHQFSANEVSTFINDSTFGDFVTGERYSMIIDGKVFEHGVEHAFRYSSAITLNLAMQFDSSLVVTTKNSTKLVLLVDPNVLFRIGFIVADPRDPNNKSLIDNNIRFCFRALRHFL